MTFNFIKGKNESTKLAIKMAISLVLAVIVGTLFMLLREFLISNDKASIWNFINNLLFQDISTEEGKNSIGIFYILGQLFINCLQLIIIPMVFSSIALSMCHIGDTKKLGRISSKTLLGFLATSIYSLIVACLFGFIAYKLGLFSVNINADISSSINTNVGSNPLLVIIDMIPNNISSTLSDNSMVLAIVFLAVVVGLCINSVGDKILVLKNLLIDINNILLISVFALIASVGTPSAPGASSIILFTVLTGMGFNNSATLVAYSLILAINRPMDMLVTCLNVAGDSATAIVVSNSEGCLDKDIYMS